MRPSNWLSSLAVTCAAAVAQTPVTLHDVAGATATAVGVLFPRGFDDDPPEQSGLAAVAAAARLELGRRVADGSLASGVQVGSDYAIVFVVVGADQAARAVAFLEAVRGSGEDLEDDALTLAVARAALAADDAEFLYPGDVLRTRARARMGRGTGFARPPAGLAGECSALTPATVRAHLAAPSAMRVAALGVVDATWREALAAVAWPTAPCPPRGAAVCRASWGQRAMTEDVSERADSPYLGAAVAAPAPDARAAWAMAVEVARARAFRAFQLRGRELFARAPFVRWSWLRADPIAMFFRRGEDHVRLLPGERAKASIVDEVAATRRELERLLTDLRDRAPSEAECAAARAALRSRLALPAAGEQAPWASEPATLPGRLEALLLGAHHAVDVGELDRVRPADVARSLAETLAPERVSWHAITPRPRDGLGYRPR